MTNKDVVAGVMIKCSKNGKGEIEKALGVPEENEPKCRPDSCWSWLVCAGSTMLVVIIMGIAYSFGLLLPSLMETFDETRQTTGIVRSTKTIVKLNVKHGIFLS